MISTTSGSSSAAAISGPMAVRSMRMRRSSEVAADERGIGSDIAQFMLGVPSTTLIAVGMAAFLAAVTQAPMTSFIIVMEMVDGHGLVLSLMAAALLASGISRLVSVPLYAALADLQVRRVVPAEPPLLRG